MINLTQKDIGEFKELFLKETGKSISDAEAEKYARSVLGLVALVVQPEFLTSDT
jgi:hypothetical protein